MFISVTIKKHKQKAGNEQIEKREFENRTTDPHWTEIQTTSLSVCILANETKQNTSARECKHSRAEVAMKPVGQQKCEKTNKRRKMHKTQKGVKMIYIKQ